MSASINSPCVVDQLRQEYETKREKFDRYAAANFMFDLLEGDITYCELLLESKTAYRDWKRESVGDEFYNMRFAEVINHQIQLVETRLTHLRRGN